MKILGIDEAGRGCVLGSLYVGAFCFSDENSLLLEATGATDSKKLSAKKRQAILEKLGDVGDCRFLEITPQQIDNGNINRLEEVAFVDHIIHFQPDIVYIDAPAHPKAIPGVVARLKEAVGRSLESLPKFIVEPKADLKYRSVGAASIVAKVNRDHAIRQLGEVGSGYPSDPKTRSWLKGFFDRNEELPACVRKRWGTVQTLRQQSLL